MRPHAILCWLLLLVPAAAAEQNLRHFASWRYTQNAPKGELNDEDLEGRKLGYWDLEFDADGKVVRGTHRGPDGTRWLSFEDVEEDARIHADLYGSSGEFLRRKSTALTTRSPRLEGAGER